MSAPKTKPVAPVVVLHAQPSGFKRYVALMVTSLVGSALIHVLLLGLFFLFMLPAVSAQKDNEDARAPTNLQADELPKEVVPFATGDFNPARDDPEVDINYPVNRRDEISVPGTEIPEARVGLKGAPDDREPVTLPPPGGYGEVGQSGVLAKPGLNGLDAPGDPGGVLRGLGLPGGMGGRSAATRAFTLRIGGGTDKSEAAVTRGLKWLARQQLPDGRWMLDSPNLPPGDRGTEKNDVAATALGLLPLLAAGKTHKAGKDNDYDKVIDKGLKFLLRQQDKKTGYFGVSMYTHGLATIAMCEAYGLTQDPLLRRPAQSAINLLVNTQHEAGGWRYGPSKAPGDLSITGWQIMAIKSAQMAGLDVPMIAGARAKSFLETCANKTDEGYGYVPGNPSSARMTAVGLLCRQYMENWGPSHPRMIKAVGGVIDRNPPDRQDVYYYYYATQVMHHFGGEKWQTWNDKMREFLIKTQDGNEASAHYGSWSAAGDEFGRHGGRLMMTSLNLLTLEVYYRYLPLYYRDAGAKMDKAVQAAQ